MKRIQSLVLVLVMLAVMFLSSVTAFASEYDVNITYDFEENLIFSTYDVDMYLDGTKLATLPHGKDGQKSFTASEGKHTLWFYKKGKNSPSGRIDLDVTGNTKIRCGIHCHSSKITIDHVGIESDNAASASTQTRSLATDAESEPEDEELPIAEEPVVEKAATETESAAPAAQTNSGNGVWIDFENASDEELEEAISKIKAVQRSRIKTKISLDKSTVSLTKGKTEKITATVEDLPEGVTAGKITAESADKSIATVANGTIKAVANGSTVITFSSTLSDGTEISEECKVNVIVPIKSITPVNANMDLGAGERAQAEFKFNPADATKTDLSYSSSDSGVATVNSDGVITAKGIGTAKITAKATDGSNASAAITVKVSKKDDVGKTFTNTEGVALTVLNVKQTKGSGFSEADAGKIIVLVELQIENKSSEEISINSMFGFEAVCDDYSVDYSFTADMNTENSLSSTDLKPGRKLKGWKGYEVPQNWKEMIITFTPDVSLLGRGDPIEFVIYNNK